jgi:adenosylcobinamide-GDP ribazoletransferase
VSPRLLVVALGWLTRLPLPRVAHRDGDLRRALPWFPLVGALVGLVAAAVRWVTEPLWGPLAATAAAVLAAVALTGALHEDGLADAADGLWGGGDAERRAEIMRDSRVGTYGLVAVTGALLLRIALLAPLGAVGFLRAAVAAHALSRGAMVLLARLGPPLPGSSAQLVERPSRAAAAGGVAAAVAVGLAALGPAVVVPAAVVLALVLAFLALCLRRLGGLTGDTFGALAVLAELAALAAAVPLLQPCC